MKKQRRKPASKQDVAASKATQAAREAERAKQSNRREFFGRMRNVAITVVLLAVAGFFTMRTVQAGIAEADLTRIGNGTPSVVQVHDPQCGDCQVLQQQTRSILGDHDDNRFTYLVADLNTLEGAALARQYRATRVTLLLFDAAGAMVQTVRGPIDKDALRGVIDGHLAAYGEAG